MANDASMDKEMHSRPLWMGLLASVLCMPLVVATWTALSSYSLMIPPLAVFFVGICISGMVTLVLALPLVLWLRRLGRLNALVLCIAGIGAGAFASGVFTYNSSFYPEMADRDFALQIARQAALSAMPEGGIFGLISAIALCIGAGVPFISNSRRESAAAGTLR